MKLKSDCHNTIDILSHTPVSDLIAAGQVEVLQPVEVRCSLRHPLVTDLCAPAECQAGEAAAVPGNRQQAGISDLWQHGQRQALEIRVAKHL